MIIESFVRANVKNAKEIHDNIKKFEDPVIKSTVEKIWKLKEKRFNYLKLYQMY